jgi:hypothetical protein
MLRFLAWTGGVLILGYFVGLLAVLKWPRWYREN